MKIKPLIQFYESKSLFSSKNIVSEKKIAIQNFSSTIQSNKNAKQRLKIKRLKAERIKMFKIISTVLSIARKLDHKELSQTATSFLEEIKLSGEKYFAVKSKKIAMARSRKERLDKLEEKMDCLDMKLEVLVRQCAENQEDVFARISKLYSSVKDLFGLFGAVLANF
ncbi:hypothetical protein MHBO_001461 [Bonamia ostreae]|uniref:Uncharacterized protein n=1 Tax=Bonamia ostreae TaxID=126728 RepID=A0ABV2AJ08_9EUKA